MITIETPGGKILLVEVPKGAQNFVLSNPYNKLLWWDDKDYTGYYPNGNPTKTSW